MKKKLFILYGFLIIILLILIPLSIASEINNNEIFGRTHLRAIGRYFHICDEDGGLYGHIFLGLNRFKLVFNEEIYMPKENIKWIIITKNIVNCVYKE